MIGTESLFPFRQRTLVERLRVDVTTLGVVKQCQTVQCRGNIGVNGTVGFFSYRQGALEQRYGIGVTTLGAAKLRQIVQRHCNIRMIGTEFFSRMSSDRL